MKKKDAWENINFGFLGGMVGALFIMLLFNWAENIESCGKSLIWCSDFFMLIIILAVTIYLIFMRKKERNKK